LPKTPKDIGMQRRSQPTDQRWRLFALSSGLKSRLLVIAFVPLVVLFAGATNQIVEATRQYERADFTVAKVDDLVETIDAQAALNAELLPTEAIGTGRGFGVQPEVISKMLGFDVAERLRVARPATDAALRPQRFSQVYNTILAIRGAADQGLKPPKDQTWTTAGEIVSDLRREDLADLDQIVDIDQVLTIALDDLLDAEQVASSYNVINIHAFELTQSTGEQREVRRDLSAEEALARRSLVTLQSAQGARTSASLRLLLRSPDYVKGLSVIDRMLEEPTKPLIADLVGAADRFQALLNRTDSARVLLSAAADDLRTQALRSRSDARNTLVRTGLLTALIGALAALVALLIARSISRPLQALAQRADRVAQGLLDTDYLVPEGPGEVQRVTSAMNDLVTNLKTLDLQVDALAAGDLSAEVLGSTVPGGLGASVRRTVDRLSGSIRAREELQQQLAYEATHDPLTQLANRQAILEMLSGAIARSDRYGQPTACLFIDLDHFKQVNDAFGHAVGDQVLVVAGERLAKLIRSVDGLGRLGGDEFVIVADRLAKAEDALILARRAVDVLSEPYEIDGRVCVIGASVGVAIADNSGLPAVDVLQNADLAVYRAKRRGRGNVEIFDEGLRREIERRSHIEVAFRRALDNHELSVAYQPIITVDSTGPVLVGHEALVRWCSQGQMVSPAEFVPVLEMGPQIVDLGRFVLLEALHQLARWRSEGPISESRTISINLSGRHLAHADVVTHVSNALKSTGVPPECLILELTETALLGDLSIAQERLGELRSMGVRIAIDDFGTGFTSISQLALLPIDILKIDRSFVNQLDDETQRPIVQMMIAVGHALGLRVVAEGVELVSEASALAELGCTVHQGWLYGKAVPAAEALQLQ
jgi:diguanylate cyclase (GGDEF)-like protein